ncbi:hypothetical protein EV421DRAFT_2015831 [Armillaria borealis]|uniref:Uncharacterized protein n=1 Tax=Armillaria borealis TaxID=47425 RepID=A0AA39MZU2_9AGAR|nr:hypothetical protein EV421DRAFT_2015831 [Armillaria borealis]
MVKLSDSLALQGSTGRRHAADRTFVGESAYHMIEVDQGPKSDPPAPDPVLRISIPWSISRYLKKDNQDRRCFLVLVRESLYALSFCHLEHDLKVFMELVKEFPLAACTSLVTVRYRRIVPGISSAIFYFIFSQFEFLIVCQTSTNDLSHEGPCSTSASRHKMNRPMGNQCDFIHDFRSRIKRRSGSVKSNHAPTSIPKILGHKLTLQTTSRAPSGTWKWKGPNAVDKMKQYLA